jgi:hypothetical protein
MDAYGTNLGEKFAASALEKYYETAVQPLITNDDYEKLLSAGGASKFSVLTFGDVTLQTYTGSTLTLIDPTESEGELDPSQQVAYYFPIRSLSEFESYVNDPGSKLVERATKQLKQGIDTYVLGLYADVGSGNRVGTDYTTGSVTVTATTGAVVGTNTVFTSAMVGLGFKANGHTKWYRVKTYTNGTNIVIENDSDDDTSIYDGGAVSAGSSYTIEAATVLTVTSATIADYIDTLAEKLDAAEIPKEDRWLVVNAKIAHLIKQSTEYTPAVESAYRDVVQKGLLGFISGFQVLQNERVAGNNTTGYYILAGHKSAITFAMEYKNTAIEMDLIGNFGKAYKGLIVYGAKVLDERRRALAYLWCKI